MARPTLITPPTVAAVSADELLSHRRDDGADEATLLMTLGDAATRHIEQWCGRAIMTQGWRMTLDAFPAGLISLPVGPVSAVDEVRYIDTTGTERVLSTSAYRVDLSAFEARLQAVSSWPATADRIGAVTIDWTAGEDACPADLKAAILLYAGHLFEHRESVVVGTIASELPMGVKALVERHRRFLG